MKNSKWRASLTRCRIIRYPDFILQFLSHVQIHQMRIITNFNITNHSFTVIHSHHRFIHFPSKIFKKSIKNVKIKINYRTIMIMIIFR
ncbi:hypothetical protein Hanom_Chr04g00375261 [Helianthus anomalus]